MARELHGRKIIYSDAEEITSANVISVLTDTMPYHTLNSGDIDYLYNYYTGKQEIRNRQKNYRKEINNKICVNHALEVVDFKTGYLVGEPIVYIARDSSSDVSDCVDTINELMLFANKQTKDTELVNWLYICGVGYRYISNDGMNVLGEVPFEISTLDPRNTYVIYSTDVLHRPLAAVTYTTSTDGLTKRYTVYTEREYFKIVDNGITESGVHYLGSIPIIEYRANSARMGAFEAVIPLIDSINLTMSNRIDGLEQFVQAILTFVGTDPGEDILSKLKEYGALSIPEGTDVKYLAQELTQSQTQVIIDDLYYTILTICGVPQNKSGEGSTSDNGAAVVLRDGWQRAESMARTSEAMFKVSEREFLKLILNIVNTDRNLAINNLLLTDIDIKFSRRNYENIQEKSQVLTTLLNSGKVHPKLAFIYCNLFTDPEEAYLLSEEYVKKQKEEAMRELASITLTEQNGEEEISVSGNGQSNNDTE